MQRCLYTEKVLRFTKTFLARLYSKSSGPPKTLKYKFLNNLNMGDTGNIEEILAPFRLDVQTQGDLVRSLKAEGGNEFDLKKAIAELKVKKKLLEDKEAELTPKNVKFDRTKLEDLLRQRFILDQSFSIYGGIQGLYDFGPMGCAMKANLLSAWRQFFVLEEQMLEVDCSMLTPEPVLVASGHVERFTDYMVKDMKTGECFRADHLVEAGLETLLGNKKTSEETKAEITKLLPQIDNMDGKDLDQVIKKYELKSPMTGADLSEAQHFNLMFATSIGPSGHMKGYLRPETAQGIFVNFQRLLQFNMGRLPFAAAQIGNSFRNEISPRSGLIRVREFTMAEIEHFTDPNDKSHPKFERVENLEVRLFSACDQMDGKSARLIKLGDAVRQGMIANETLAYFMGRIYEFLTMVGIKPERFRFRQHMNNEMAHYACDCWDAECHTSYGWIECVGCADRSCYDLKQHAKATGAKLIAERKLPEPKTVTGLECLPQKSILGKTFKQNAKDITAHLSSLSLDEIKGVQSELQSKGKLSIKINDNNFDITPDMVKIQDFERKIHVEEIMPSVIEPSFGIGRIIYCIFEQNFNVREGDEARTYLSLPAIIAPFKCSVLPLSGQPDFMPVVKQLSDILREKNISHRVDDSSGSIGRRYARTDQIAIPYGVTIDFDTVNVQPCSVTLRERDSMVQIRVPIEEIGNLVDDLCSCRSTWEEAMIKYPVFEQQETGK